MEIIRYPSPNFDERPNGVSPDMVILHYTGMKTSEEALTRLTDSEAKVSTHHLIDEKGQVYQLVDEMKRAWHAGVSYWKGRENLNHYAIGIELANPGHEFGYHPFPKVQVESLLWLLDGIFSRHKIKPENVVGHSDVAPGRKEDPGELFNWKLLADKGFSIWPKQNFPVQSGGRVLARPGDKNEKVAEIQKKLSAFGYNVEVTGEFDSKTVLAITAIRRRFTPQFLHPLWDECIDSYLSN